MTARQDSRQIERIRCSILSNSREAARRVAGEIATLIRIRQAEGRTCVLGLATGSTPTGIYAELIRLHREEGLSFRNVVTFNLDEYYPMQPEDVQSYVRFMKEHLFDHIDIAPENANVPDGTIPMESVNDYCRDYEARIAALGGIDIQILGIGRTGHIGFNEPGSPFGSRTRIVSLSETTLQDMAHEAWSGVKMPTTAVTQGLADIMGAQEILLLAIGNAKFEALRRAFREPPSVDCPASVLQTHPNLKVLVTPDLARAFR